MIPSWPAASAAAKNASASSRAFVTRRGTIIVSGTAPANAANRSAAGRSSSALPPS